MKRFDRTTPVGRSVQRIASDGLAAALSAAGASARSPPQAIHALRQTIKWLRAIVRLVEPGFPDYRREDIFLRETGMVLAAARDAEVVKQTYDRFLERGAFAPDPELSAALYAGPDASPEPALILGKAAERLATLHRRVPAWRFEASGFDLIGPGLGKVYGRMRRAERRARAEPAPARFHQLRKLVKQHRVHLDLLRASAPDRLKEQGRAAESLGETLGDIHDIDLIVGRIEGSPMWAGCRDILAAIADRRTELAKQAFRLAPELTAESRSAFTDRMRRNWKAWRN